MYYSYDHVMLSSSDYSYLGIHRHIVNLDENGMSTRMKKPLL